MFINILSWLPTYKYLSAQHLFAIYFVMLKIVVALIINLK